jgi:hypothetical protein
MSLTELLREHEIPTIKAGDYQLVLTEIDMKIVLLIQYNRVSLITVGRSGQWLSALPSSWCGCLLCQMSILEICLKLVFFEAMSLIVE